MKTTKVIKDQKQTRTTIPSNLVKEAGVETGHMAEWKIKKGRLSAEVMSHEEFMKRVAEETSVPSRVTRVIKCQFCEEGKKCRQCESCANDVLSKTDEVEG